MKITSIVVALLLIISGVLGSAYLIKISGAGPETSWSLAAGPWIIGFFIIVKILIPYQRRRGQ